MIFYSSFAQAMSWWVHETDRSSRPEMFCQKGFLRNFAKFTRKHLCQGVFFIKKATVAQVFFCEFCEIFKNTFFHRTPPVAASEEAMKKIKFSLLSSTRWNCSLTSELKESFSQFSWKEARFLYGFLTWTYLWDVFWKFRSQLKLPYHYKHWSTFSLTYPLLYRKFKYYFRASSILPSLNVSWCFLGSHFAVS